MTIVEKDGSLKFFDDTEYEVFRRYLEVNIQILANADSDEWLSKRVAAAMKVYAEHPATISGRWDQGEWFHHDGIAIRQFYTNDYRINGEMEERRRRSLWEIVSGWFS